jgi:hypothetical protein
MTREARRKVVVVRGGLSASYVAWTINRQLHVRGVSAEVVHGVVDRRLLRRSAAMDWLDQHMHDAGWLARASTIEAAAVQAGFSRSALMRAKARLNVTSVRVGYGRGGTWWWRHPRWTPSERGEDAEWIATEKELMARGRGVGEKRVGPWDGSQVA